MKTSKMRLWASFFLTLVIANTFSCKRFDRAINELVITREEFIFSIDESIQKIQYGLQDVEAELESLGKRFSEEQVNLVYRTDYIINVLFGEGVVAAECLIDFTAARAVHYLQLLKAEIITGVAPPPPPPLICNYSISSLDLNAPLETRSVIRAFGGDFHPIARDSFSVYFASGSDQDELLANVLDFQTNYEFTINLSDYPDEYIAQWKRLSIRYGGEEVSTFSVIQERPTPPEVRQVKATPGIYSFIPPHIQNGYDQEFYGLADVKIDVKFVYTNKQVGVRIFMSAKEIRNSRTTTWAQGWSPTYYFYTAPQGFRIKGIVGAQYFPSIVRYQDRDVELDIFHTALGLAEVMGDGRGDDAGIHTGVKFNFSYPLPIVIEEE